MNTADYFVLLDDAQSGIARLYRQWIAHDAIHSADLSHLEGCLKKGFAKHWHAVLLADYSWGRKLHDLNEDSGSLHIFWFAQLQQLNSTQVDDYLQESQAKPSGIVHCYSDVSQTEYHHAIKEIHHAIQRGASYQINYTTRLHFQAYGSPKRLYSRLKERQAVPYGALAHLPIDEQKIWLLSFSPELFLRFEGENIEAKPMKGTAKILHDGKDEQRRQALQNDSKNRAENVMIVDLLRNDLGQIAQVGSVHVSELFAVNAFGSVWQMTSRIHAKTQNPHAIAPLFQAAFPCGSITGAPKRKSMEIIERLEKSPRGFYTGSLGFIEKHANGYSGCLNVLIRTLQLQQNDNKQYSGTMGVGSGIVIDSQADDEWQECQDKAHFLQTLPAEFSLIETLYVDNRQCALLEKHIQRLNQSAKTFGFASNLQQIIHFCQNALAALPANGCFRLRLQLHANGQFSQEYSPFKRQPETLPTVAIHPHRLPENDFLRRHKTDFRPEYNAALQEAKIQNLFDFLFFDQQGRLLEGARSNILLYHNGQWKTPELSADFLPGIMRAAILENPQKYLNSKTLTECTITQQELQEAEEIYLCNALRGVFRVYLKLD